jgi:hypothetical protein
MNRDQLVAGGVAGAAFVCSAQHTYSVALASGNPWPVALVHPAGIDGLIYIGMRAVSSGRRWQGWLATVYGVAASLTFNAVSYAHVAMPAWVMAVAMPLALVLGVLVVGHEAKDKGDVPAVVPVARPVSRPRAVRVPTDVPVSLPHVPTVVSQRGPAKQWDRDLARKLLTEGDLSRKDIAERVGCSRKSIDRLAA